MSYEQQHPRPALRLPARRFLTPSLRHKLKIQGEKTWHVFQAGEFAEMAGVTVRTRHYYDLGLSLKQIQTLLDRAPVEVAGALRAQCRLLQEKRIILDRARGLWLPELARPHAAESASDQA